MKISAFHKLPIIFFLFLASPSLHSSQIEPKENSEKIITELSSQIETLNRKELIELSKAYAALSQHLAAIKTLNLVISKNPKDFEAFTLRGEQEILFNKSQEALESLKQALELNPKYEPAYLKIIEIYEARKNRYELRLVFQDMVEKIGEKQFYTERLCEITTLDGLYDISIDYCRKGANRFKKSDIYPTFLGITLMETGKTKEGLGVLKKASAQFPDSKRVHLVYADYLFKEKNYIDAVKYYRNATMADSKNLDAFIGLAKTYVEIQKFDDSIEAYQAACKIDRKTVIDIRKSQNVIKLKKDKALDEKFKTLQATCGK